MRIKWGFNGDLMRKWGGNEDLMRIWRQMFQWAIWRPTICYNTSLEGMEKRQFAQLFLGPRKRFYNSIINFSVLQLIFPFDGKMNYRTEKINYRTKMGNVRQMGENRIIEQQRSTRIIERRKKLGVNSDTFFFHTFRGKQNYRTTGYGK